MIDGREIIQKKHPKYKEFFTLKKNASDIYKEFVKQLIKSRKGTWGGPQKLIYTRV